MLLIEVEVVVVVVVVVGGGELTIEAGRGRLLAQALVAHSILSAHTHASIVAQGVGARGRVLDVEFAHESRVRVEIERECVDHELRDGAREAAHERVVVVERAARVHERVEFVEVEVRAGPFVVRCRFRVQLESDFF